MAEGGAKTVRDATCPFCALCCDDLTIEIAGDGAIAVRENGCPISRRGFARMAARTTPAIAGEPAEMDAAIARAAALIGSAQSPVFAALRTDLAGMRAALRLAERVGAVVDDLESDGLMRNLRIVQDGGTMTTTLSEVRNRMDVMLIVGPDPAAKFPRLHERCIAPSDTPFGERPRRRIYRIGPAGANKAPGVVEMACEDRQLPAAIAALRALANGRAIAAESAGGIATTALWEIAAALNGAAYGVIAWDAAALPGPSAELVVETLIGMLRDLNETVRAAGLPLGGSENLIGANQVCTWQSGTPLRTSFAGGAPAHDPLLHSARRMLAAGEADMAIWISAFADTPPPETDAAVIALAPADTRFASPPAVFIPVGTPGIDHAGQIVRTDGIVALPLATLRPAGRTGGAPSAADILGRIERELAPERARA
jgi:formylmethanofuran dehydrogenase subunit B